MGTRFPPPNLPKWLHWRHHEAVLEAFIWLRIFRLCIALISFLRGKLRARDLVFSTVGPQSRLPTCDVTFTQPSVLHVLLDKSGDHNPTAQTSGRCPPLLSFYRMKEQKSPRASGPCDSCSQGTYHPGGPAPGTQTWGEVTRDPEGTRQDLPAPPSPESSKRRSNALVRE